MSTNAEAGLARRQSLIAEVMAKTGIDEALIQKLVHRFYQRAREDDLIGPIFNARVENWDEHLARLCDFWSSVTLMSGRYHGQPMPVHAALRIEPHHFDRWLELFALTAREVCPPHAAAQCLHRAPSAHRRQPGARHRRAPRRAAPRETRVQPPL